ncbi:hypothetical protein ACGF3K_03745 [Streptomyces sp. NPDC047980]|uniref:hypothetical protein n=1 Tax=Streptomyces sp. NPDC047980 TaxID=3365494 RepID=UPI00371F1078
MRIVASAGGAVALALAVVPMTPVQAASLNPDNGNDRIACSTSALTNAIDGVLGADGGTIELARDCRYVLTSALPTIDEPVTLRGGKGTSIERSVAAGTPQFRIFEVGGSAGFLTLDDLTVKNGDGAGDGGAVLVRTGRTLLLKSATLTRNRAAGNGGAVANDGGRVILRDSKVEKNSAGVDGGGIHTSGGVVSLDSSAVSQNRATADGGGVASADGYVTATHSSVDKNEADGGGGGVDNDGTADLQSTGVTGNRAGGDGGGIRNTGTLIVGRSSVNKNTAANGGGIHNTGLLWIGRSVVKENVADADGGGLWNDNEATVESSDITGNETRDAGSQGGGVYNENGAPGGNTVLTDSTVTKNQASVGGGIFRASGSVTLNRTRVKENVPDNCSPSGTVAGCVG